jgi:rRNA-processing protein FCF1
MRETITTYMRSKIAKFVRKMAKEDELTVSSYLERLAEREMERKTEEDDDDVVLTRAEIQRRLENADDPRNCIVHNSDEELIQHLREVAREVI